MTADGPRLNHIRAALETADLAALVCSLPVNVLLISGYWPVVGTALALATHEGCIAILAPEDEHTFATRGWADDVQLFQPGSVDEIRTAVGAVRGPLRMMARKLGIAHGRVGYEAGAAFQPMPYVACHLYGTSLPGLLADSLPDAELVPVDDLLARLRAVKTPRDLTRIRLACRIAAQAFEEGVKWVHRGEKETEIASHFRAPLFTQGVGWDSVERADGAVYCMSGPNAARAYAAYQLSSDRAVAAGELVLIHCNSYADGYFTDITRTYCLGPTDPRQLFLLESILAAREAALRVIRPGARAAGVDRAAREVLRERGLGSQFKHSTGHGVGFAAIDQNARPRLHPKSGDVLQEGMVCNVEPGVYFDGKCGLRHCDMVAVTADGVELLTPFHDSPQALLLDG
jgi:Xaa-Pro aminopeptidase